MILTSVYGVNLYSKLQTYDNTIFQNAVERDTNYGVELPFGEMDIGVSFGIIPLDAKNSDLIAKLAQVVTLVAEIVDFDYDLEAGVPRYIRTPIKTRSCTY